MNYISNFFHDLFWPLRMRILDWREERGYKGRISDQEILDKANEICKPHNLKAEFAGKNRSKGVQGDEKTYTKVLILTGPWPGHQVLSDVSTKISNTVPINRVTFQIDSPQ